MANAKLTFTDDQWNLLLRGLGSIFRAGTLSSEEYLAVANPIIERHKPVVPAWGTLPERTRALLFQSTCEEVGDSIKEHAATYLDECELQELTEMYGFDEDVVLALCYADPDEVAKSHTVEADELEALVAMKMFTADWKPTDYAERWLKEYVGREVDSDKAKEFVAVE